MKMISNIKTMTFGTQIIQQIMIGIATTTVN